MNQMDQRRMCPNCRAFITRKDRVCPYCEATISAPVVELRNPKDILGGLIPGARFTTSMILLINFALYCATALYSMKSGNNNALMGIDGRTLFQFGASFPGVVQSGQWWRLVTAGFLHGGLFHILMNSWVLYDLGALVEEIFGTARFLLIYFAATVFGFYVSSTWGHFSVGASAGIFGLLGAMIALGVTERQGFAGAMRGMFVRWAIYGLLLGLLPGIDNAAHMGGLAAGFGVAFLARTPGLVVTPKEKIVRGAAWGVGLIVAYCMLQLYISFSGASGV